jgi:hypothetical protein
MKNPVVSLPAHRRIERTRALQGAVTRFQAWQRSLQWSAVGPTRRRPQPVPRLKTRG